MIHLAGVHTRLLVVQATPFCNINCTYCYLPDRSNTARLPLESIGPMFARLFAFPTIRERITIVWHAGEPMVLSIAYYQAAFEAIRRVTPSGLLVRHSFQTNGTLISNAWCVFFREWQVSIGVSIDGPRHINDLNRLDRNGRSTFDKTVAGIACLKANRHHFHVISVLTATSLGEPDALYDFYRDNGVTQIAFNIEELEGANVVSSLSGDEHVARYKDFLARFLVRVSQDGSHMNIRELETTLQAIQGWSDSAQRRNEQTTPFGIISVDINGDMATFSPELLGMMHASYGDMRIGNVFAQPFDEIAASPKLAEMWRDVETGCENCRLSCRYFGGCGGGAPSNKLFENGSFATTHTQYCRFNVMVPTDLVLDLIDQSAIDHHLQPFPDDGLFHMAR